MTAFASNILAALSGAVAKPGAGGVGSGEGSAGGFEALLAGLIGEAAALAPATGGDKSGSNLPLQAAASPDDTSQGQAAAEALLAAMLPVAAPPTPTPTAAASEAEPAPAVAAAANAVAFAVDAAVDAALPAPAEVAVDAVADVLAGAVSREEPSRGAPVAPTATASADAAVEAQATTMQTTAAAAAPPAASAASAPMSPKATAALDAIARTDLPSLNGEKSKADAAPAAADPKAPTVVAEVATPPVATPASPRGEVAPAPASGTQPAATATAQAAAPASDTAKAVQQAVTTMAAVSTPAAASKAAAGATATPAASQAPVEAEAPVAVTPGAIAEAAVEPQALPAETAAAIAATIAPAARAITAPTETRRTVKTADVRTNLEADPVGPRSEKAAAKVAEVQSSIVDAALDAAPDAPLVAPVDLADADLAPQSSAEGVAAEPALAAAAPRHGETAPIVRGSPETVQKLAADIVQKLNGQNSKFDLQLDPLGLGKVDVSVEISADGRLTAALSFDSAAAAADLRGRSAELRQALQQAGFDVSDNGLSFGQNPGFGGREAAGDQSRGQWSSRAFKTAQAGLDDADARLTAALSSSSRTPSGGVDIRI